MDIPTHALASVVVARIAIPGAPRLAWIAMVLAGTIPDLDELSALSGPFSYLRWHHTFTHSIAAASLIAALCVVLYHSFGAKPKSSSAPSLPVIFVSLLCVGLLHLVFDVCQSDGIMAFWPFSARRLSTDWLAYIDPWIIVLLAAALLLPELLRLVSAEIGSKDKSPRGRTGAIVGLAFVVLYIGTRAMLHANVIASINSRSYRGELPRRVAAFPESASPLTWHAIVETDRALHELLVSELPGATFDPEATVALFKPEPSPALEQARQSDAARQFLSVARFPKASVEKTKDGYEVQLRDLRYAAAFNARREIAVLVRTDLEGKLVSDELIWAADLRRK